MSVPSPDVPDWPGGPDDAVLDSSLRELAARDGPADLARGWPVDLWDGVRDLGATLWSLGAEWGGRPCDRSTLLVRYARLAEASLTAAFLLTQHDAAVRRLAAAQGVGRPMAEGWLAQIGQRRAFATVGISQLTTSRRHGPRALTARPDAAGGFRLDGAMPWVTAAPAADVIVTGAVTEEDQQLLAAVPRGRGGLTIGRPYRLAALEASCTCEIRCEAVTIHRAEVLAGPSADVMATPGLAGTGGLETSALALGQARAALVALAAEAPRRDDLAEPLDALAEAWNELAAELLNAAGGKPEAPAPGLLRSRANALVLRATQAFLTVRKGTGFVLDEPAQRWARQALFFLVWSCPTPIASAALRDLAGLCPA